MQSSFVQRPTLKRLHRSWEACSSGGRLGRAALGLLAAGFAMGWGGGGGTAVRWHRFFGLSRINNVAFLD